MKRTSFRSVVLLFAALVLLATTALIGGSVVGAGAFPGSIEQITPAGTTSENPETSDDGRYVAFQSIGSLVPADTNGFVDIYVYDRLEDTTEWVSMTSTGGQPNAGNYNASISGDGRYVGWETEATNIVPNDTNARWDIFLHDMQTGTTELASVSSSEAQGDGNSGSIEFSRTGRFYSFTSYASTFDPSGYGGVFVRDRDAGTTEMVSLNIAGQHGFGLPYRSDISGDGRFVAFLYSGSDLVPDVSGQDVYLRDRQAGTTELISMNDAGEDGDGESGPFGEGVEVSDSGRYVTYFSNATNLVADDTNNKADVFVRDRQAGTTIRVSVDSSGNQANDDSYEASISGDGRYVAFQSTASNLAPSDTNGTWDVFVHDLTSGSTELVSTNGPGGAASVSGEGNTIAWNGRGPFYIYVLGEPPTAGFTFTGFFAPVDNPPVVNKANAGQTIPVKWRITDDNGVGISDPASFVSLTSGSTTCSPGDPIDVIETYSGSSGLQYLGDGNWQFNWKTPKSYAGQCRTMRLNLADGDQDRIAHFQFK